MNRGMSWDHTCKMYALLVKAWIPNQNDFSDVSELVPMLKLTVLLVIYLLTSTILCIVLYLIRRSCCIFAIEISRRVRVYFVTGWHFTMNQPIISSFPSILLKVVFDYLKLFHWFSNFVRA